MATHSNIVAWKIPWTESGGILCPWDDKESDMTEAPQTKTEVIDTLEIFIVVVVGVVCERGEGIAKT